MKNKALDENSSMDPVAKYLSEMGAIPVMNATRELEAFKEVESSEAALLSHILCHRKLGPAVLKELTEQPPEVFEAVKVHKKDKCISLVRSLRFSESGRDWYTETVRTAVGLAKNGGEKNWSKELLKLDSTLRQAKSFCIDSNLRLVVSVARKYSKSKSSMTFNDIIQEGNLGLIKAVDRFDVERGIKFSTYAMWWIRASINRSIQDLDQLVRIPVHFQDDINSVNKAETKFMVRFGRRPTRKELSELLGMSEKKLELVLESRLVNSSISLDQGISTSRGETEAIVNVIEDPESIPLEDELQMKGAIADMAEILTTLTPVESQVIRWRYGFDDQEPLSLDEVGGKLGRSRERARQIQVDAINKLRRNKRILSHFPDSAGNL